MKHWLTPYHEIRVKHIGYDATQDRWYTAYTLWDAISHTFCISAN